MTIQQNKGAGRWPARSQPAICCFVGSLGGNGPASDWIERVSRRPAENFIGSNEPRLNHNHLLAAPCDEPASLETTTSTELIWPPAVAIRLIVFERRIEADDLGGHDAPRATCSGAIVVLQLACSSRRRRQNPPRRLQVDGNRCVTLVAKRRWHVSSGFRSGQRLEGGNCQCCAMTLNPAPAEANGRLLGNFRENSAQTRRVEAAGELLLLLVV